MPFYHYTNNKAVEKILESKVLNSSKSHNGNGVFLTKLPPSAGKDNILKNNHDSFIQVVLGGHPRGKDVQAVLVFNEDDIFGTSSV
jgi:hypothetical protein